MTRYRLLRTFRLFNLYRLLSTFRLLGFHSLIMSLTFNTYAQVVLVEATSISEGGLEPSRSAMVISFPLDQPQMSDQSTADVLTRVPGLEVLRQGGPGQTSSVFIRGARSEDTLVLVDGIEINDAMSPSGGFDFSALSTLNMERIEVYRGPQSVRFGAGALGGVINLVTREGKLQSNFGYFSEIGSFSTQHYAISHSGQGGNLTYSMGGSHYTTLQPSAASELSGNFEPDGTQINTGSLKLAYYPSQTAKIESIFRYSDSEVEIDSFGGVGGDDPNSSTKARQFSSGIIISDRFFNEQFKGSFGIYFSSMERDGLNKADFKNATESEDHFLSERKKVQSDFDWLIGEFHTLRFLLNFSEEIGTSDSLYNGKATKISQKSQSTVGESVTYLFDNSIWFYDIGIRSDQRAKLGNIPSSRFSFGRRFPLTDTKAFITYGTGYKLPSLYQLYSVYGNLNLKRENSAILEATVEQKTSSENTFLFSLFENKFSDMIDFDINANRYLNISQSQARGFEFQSSNQINKEIQLQFGYTYLDCKDENTGQKLLRRAQNSWKLSSFFEGGNYRINIQYVYRGEREDLDPSSFQRIKVEDYSLVSINGVYPLNRGFKFHARIENLFDEKYEEIAGYGTSRRSFYLGISGEI